MEIEFKPLTIIDAEKIDDWLEGRDLHQFMSGWTPRTVREGRWEPSFCRWDEIVVDQNRIGTVWLERFDPDDRIADFGILIAEPEYRGRGIGTRVIQIVEQDGIDSWAIEAVRLRVRASNENAIACYTKAGYQITHQTVKEVGGMLLTVLHMEHRLI